MEEITNKNNSFTDYNKIINLTIAIFPITYIFGFIVINSYLSRYSLYDFVLFDAVFLKAGLLFLVFLLSLVFLFHISFQNANNFKLYNLPHAIKFIFISLISLVFIFFLLSIFIKSPVSSMLFIYERQIYLLILLVFFVNFLKTTKILTIVQILMIFAYFILKSFYSTLLTYAWWFSLVVFFLFVFYYEENILKKYYNKFVFIMISLIVVCSSFGAIIYDQIPAIFGGGKPYKIGVNKENIILSKSEIRIDTLDILHENSNKYLVRNKNKEIIFVNKSDFGSVISIKQN